MSLLKLNGQFFIDDDNEDDESSMNHVKRTINESALHYTKNEVFHEGFLQ